MGFSRLGPVVLDCLNNFRFPYCPVTVIRRAGLRLSLQALLLLFVGCGCDFSAQAQTLNQIAGQRRSIAPDAQYRKRRNEWFHHGRNAGALPAAEMHRRAFQAKLRLRAQRASALTADEATGQVSMSSGTWVPLGPMPLASDASGNGTQDYHQVSGRATAIAIDPADSTGNTIYIGGAQSGIWKSTNAANPNADSVTWTPVADTQATLSIGAIAIQPGNADPSKSVILAATGEANNSGDSYFGLGILRSTDAGNSWAVISTANNGSLSLSGLGGARIAFNTTPGQWSTVVVAMATTAEGLIDGAISPTTLRGLYTSRDAGLTWTYNALNDPGGATDATSASSVVYNAAAGKFFASVRYHGFYSSPDGVTWTRLTNQPGGLTLSTAACPAQSLSNNYACPIYRGQIAVVPGRNEMYAWYISLAADGTAVDRGIWKSVNSGASWSAISSVGIANCGDVESCGVEQGSYNLELLALPNVDVTDLYAGAINIYKCTISSINPDCSATPFMNLTHAYGCSPIAAPAHVHPAQHAIASTIPSTGSDSGNALIYFANDGGIYRALDGYTGLNTGSCSGVNQFDDLNQNLGSMTQFVGFSQHPTDLNTIFGGAQGNGSPATKQATTNFSWVNVLGGDGAWNAIDPTAPANWYASNPDVPPGGLGIQLCSSGVNCRNGDFDFVVTSNTLGGDDGGFHFPFVLDPHSSSAMLVGTCRVWRGSRMGGAFTALSPNFDTLGSGTCSGSEVNKVRALATAGLTNNDGSSLIYTTTDGFGPLDGPLNTPSGGRVWVSTDASAGAPAFADVTDNGPQGNINPNQFPISSVATDSSDATGYTAYVTIMGFTGGTGHVWKTTNAGATWIDFTANLPDSPVNAVVVYPPMSQVYVATDVGVFASSTSTPNWAELGPNPSTNQAGFLPNVAVTSLGVFASGGQQLLRASTYGRGMWQFNLVITPDFQLTVSNSPLTVFAGQSASLNGTITAQNGYASSVTLNCVAGTTSPPGTCSPSPASLTPGSKTPFSVTVGGASGDYNFNVQAAGSDSKHITHIFPVSVHLIGFGLTNPSPPSVTVGRGSTSPPVSFKVTAAGSFSQPVTVSCATVIPNAVCTLTPSGPVWPTAGALVSMTAAVSVPGESDTGSSAVTIQATTTGAPSTLTTSFTLNVIANPDFVLSEPSAFPQINAGSTGVSGPISIASQDGFVGSVNLKCPNTFGPGSCSISPSSVNSFPTTATLTINGTNFAAGSYSLSISGTSGSVVHTLAVPFNVGDYTVSAPSTLAATPGAQVTATLKLASVFSYSGKIDVTCDPTALPAAMCVISPANQISLISGGTANVSVTINVPNDATAGSYDIKLNTMDSTGAPNHFTVIAMTLGQDFLVKSTTSSQTVTAGQTSGPYNLSVQAVGASFDGAVTLACTAGLPAQAQCVFSPSGSIIPGRSAINVVMSISTSASRSASAKPRVSLLLLPLWTLFPAVLLIRVKERIRCERRGLKVLANLSLICSLFLLVSCGGVSTGGGGNGGTTPPSDPVTYHVTVTGNSAGTPPDAGQSTVVTLIVN